MTFHQKSISDQASAEELLVNVLTLAASETTDDIGLGSAGSSPRAAAPAAVSEAADLIARLIPVLPEKTVVDLGRLLQKRLTTFNPQVTRYARLGLLIELVSDGTGVLPSTREYEAARAERAARGETDWPAHATLIAAYGSWVSAVRAAMLLWRDGSGSRVPSSTHHMEFTGAYSFDEAVGALRACYHALGTWPTEGEYREWRRTARELARNAGVPYSRHPSRDAWGKLFGGWAEFLAAAQRAEAGVT